MLGVQNTLLEDGIIFLYVKRHNKKGAKAGDHQQFNQRETLSNGR
jgi:hypothetical protein